MPFYIRKSLRFGPIRFNLSKSGVGVSAGIKGFRIGSGPRGNYVHMGRGGLYYRASLSTPSNRIRPTEPSGLIRPPSLPSERDVVMLDIQSGDTGQIVDTSSRALVEELQNKRRLVRFSPGALVAGLAAFIYAASSEKSSVWYDLIVASTIVAYLLLRIWDANRKTTVIFYEFADDAESVYRRVYAAFESLSAVQRIWHIPAQGAIHERKYYAGASELVNRTRIKVLFKSPPDVKTNIPIPSLPLGGKTIYFFPDKVLVFDDKTVGGLSYDSLSAAINPTRFVESESVPSDSKIIGQTWRYVNKGGGPDRRFKDNPEIPIAQYEQVRLTSASGLDELLHVSRMGSFQNVMNASQTIGNYVRSP